MTAADALSAQPAARPEPSAARTAAPENKGAEHKGKSFADVLGAETTEKTETTDTTEELAELAAPDEVSTDTTIIAQPAQPAPPPAIPLVTPVTASPAAILAGLDPNIAAAEGTSTTPAVDGVKPAVVPEFAIDTPAPAPALTPALAPAPTVANVEVGPPADAETVLAAPAQQEVATQQVAVLTQPVATTPAKPAAKKDTKVEAAVPAIDAAETASSNIAVEGANAKPVVGAAPTQPVVTTAAPAAPPVTPEQPAQPTSAPGAERAAASVETAPSTTAKTATANTKTAAASADANVQTSANKAVQAAATATDAAPDFKIDATTSSVASTSANDALTASRTSGVETSKAAQSTPAAQAAPAATIQVYSRMIERFDGRAQRYEIRLDPAELGRVDVRIEVGADKKVHAVLAAHDSAALSDLMRGQRALEASLRQAGIDVADGGIKFELSSDTGRNLSNGANRGDTNGNANGSGNVWRNFSTMDVAVDANTATAARPWRSSRLNLVA